MKTFDKSLWIGRKFRCKDTGVVLEIPPDVRARDFYPFGNCFVDVGNGYYARYGGNIEELENDDVEE